VGSDVREVLETPDSAAYVVESPVFLQETGVAAADTEVTAGAPEEGGVAFVEFTDRSAVFECPDESEYLGECLVLVEAVIVKSFSDAFGCLTDTAVGCNYLLNLDFAGDVLADRRLGDTHAVSDFLLRKPTFVEFGGEETSEGRKETFDDNLTR